MNLVEKAVYKLQNQFGLVMNSNKHNRRVKFPFWLPYKQFSQSEAGREYIK